MVILINMDAYVFYCAHKKDCMYHLPVDNNSDSFSILCFRIYCFYRPITHSTPDVFLAVAPGKAIFRRNFYKLPVLSKLTTDTCFCVLPVVHTGLRMKLLLRCHVYHRWYMASNGLTKHCFAP